MLRIAFSSVSIVNKLPVVKFGSGETPEIIGPDDPERNSWVLRAIPVGNSGDDFSNRIADLEEAYRATSIKQIHERLGALGLPEAYISDGVAIGKGPLILIGVKDDGEKSIVTQMLQEKEVEELQSGPAVPVDEYSGEEKQIIQQLILQWQSQPLRTDNMLGESLGRFNGIEVAVMDLPNSRIVRT